MSFRIRAMPSPHMLEVEFQDSPELVEVVSIATMLDRLGSGRVLPKLLLFRFVHRLSRGCGAITSGVHRFRAIVQSSIQSLINEKLFETALDIVEARMNDKRFPSRFIIRQMALDMCLYCSDENVAQKSAGLLESIIERYGPLALNGLWERGDEEDEFGGHFSSDLDELRRSRHTTVPYDLISLMIVILAPNSCEIYGEAQVACLLRVLVRLVERDLVRSYDADLSQSIFIRHASNYSSLEGTIRELLPSALSLFSACENISVRRGVAGLASVIIAYCNADVINSRFLENLFTKSVMQSIPEYVDVIDLQLMMAVETQLFFASTYDDILMTFLGDFDTSETKRNEFQKQLSRDKILAVYLKVGPKSTAKKSIDNALLILLQILIVWARIDQDSALLFQKAGEAFIEKWKSEASVKELLQDFEAVLLGS